MATAVLISPAAVAGAVGALLLLAMFVTGIATNLARGRQPDCRCFGQIHSAPVSWKTLARNGALAAVAVLVVAQGPGAGLGAWSSGLSGTEWLALAVAMVLAVAVILGGSAVRDRRRRGRVGGPATPVPPSSTGLAVGTPAPHFSLPDSGGQRVSLDTLLAGGRPVVLVFIHEDCGACRALLADVGAWQADHRTEITVAVIARGPVEVAGLVNVLLAAGDSVARAYRAIGLPSAVLIGADAAVASPLIVGADPIRALVQSVLPGSTRTPV